MSTPEDDDSKPLPPINWREAVPWPVPPADRLVLEQMRQKEAAGAKLTPQEHARVTAIIQAARRHVHSESHVGRRKTPDERSAESEKRVGAALAKFLRRD